ncbi:MAG TPA: zinc ribbon domain-containing protein [Anaerolineae bacterium]|nr:zinc ribbon domain-containing protein [Anaerolineae bacterium]
MLQQIACPNCRTPLDLRQSAAGAYVHCAACGGEFLLTGHVCPRCGTYEAHETAFCRQCGMPLSRRCPQCQTLNWIGDEYCRQCGAALDILEIIVHRHNESTQQRLYTHLEDAPRLKAEEEAALQVRRERMMEQDRQRQIAIQRRIEERRARDKKLLNGMLVAAAVIVLILIAIGLISVLL